MHRILVAYASMAGSTVEVARAIGDEIAQRGWQVDVLPLNGVPSLDPYNAVVVGGPMIMGWHRAALGFLRRHRRALQTRPLAIFVLAMSLTDTGQASVGGVPVLVDPGLPKPPGQPGRLNFRERYARLANYLSPILNAARPARPASVAVFGGRLEYGRLKWWAVLFAMFIIQARAGDRRNWPAIRTWAAGLPAAFAFSAPQPAEAQPVA
jgi:menaquinone-dependent protoporphyrinogen oxidase